MYRCQLLGGLGLERLCAKRVRRCCALFHLIATDLPQVPSPSGILGTQYRLGILGTQYRLGILGTQYRLKVDKLSCLTGLVDNLWCLPNVSVFYLYCVPGNSPLVRHSIAQIMQPVLAELQDDA
jgi:hypothetical protein